MILTYAIAGLPEMELKISEGELDEALLFSLVKETSLEHCRKSQDNLLIILKTYGDKFVPGTEITYATYLRTRATELGIPYTEYTHTEILTVIKDDPNWNSPVEP